jgi:magnesium chelatase family protein
MMVKQRLTPILPLLISPEGLNIEKRSSIADLLSNGQALLARRPFRSLHHFISDAGLISGGRSPGPGGVGLAHCGFLFRDKLPASRDDIPEALRQSVESA